jgi:hypothetical protein
MALPSREEENERSEVTRSTRARAGEVVDLRHPASNVTLTATFAADAHILYWDEASQTMQVGGWGGALTPSNYASKMLFFKFGGVVGFTNGEDWDTSTSIKFNPSLTEITGYGTSQSDSALPDVPSFTTTDYDNGIRDVSSATYHTLANIKLGKGDPCKLVGLTANQVKTGLIDNGLYRLPTRSDNQTFFGTSSNSNDTTYSTWIANGENEADPPTRTFYMSDPANAVLPAAGGRYPNGTVRNRGTYGWYWPSTPLNSTDAYILHFRSDLVSSSYTYGVYGNGMAVRCVHQ